MTNAARVSKFTYAGLLMVTLATLMYEIHLTRIFSITMWYHFAFMAISVAMFGMTVGALVVQIRPDIFSQDRVKQRLAASALAFGASILVSFIAHLSIKFDTSPTVVGLMSVIATYLIIALPFIFSGICVCLALTKFPARVSELYSADLAGAALGCVLLVVLLKLPNPFGLATAQTMDGMTAVIVIALLAAVGSWLFACDAEVWKWKKATAITCAALAVFAVGHLALTAAHFPLLCFSWVKLGAEPPALYEKWNSFSRLRVFGNPFLLEKPFGWGLSPLYPPERRVSQLCMSIDAAAFTPLVHYTGNPDEVEHLKYDVTNVANYLRPNSRVLVVGVGGGRDILSALIFNQKSVLGVDINEDIINASMHVFAGYTGHLSKDSRVSFVADEARSYIARSKENFDLIQISLIDTSAATAAGAFVLTENSLYTVEAWKQFIAHLTPHGILSVSRWYVKDRPGEIYRLTALATESLKQLGITDTRKHIMIIANRQPQGICIDGVGTIMVSPEPFSTADIEAATNLANRMKFDVILTPAAAINPIFAGLASSQTARGIIANYPLYIAPPTDDSPYFFNMLRLRDMARSDLWQQGAMSFNLKAVYILGELMLTVLGLTALCIVLPLLLAGERTAAKHSLPLLVYFASIGLGFMFVEISQMQRLIIFLGHPVYSLSVVLFTLLLSSSLGSFLTRGAPIDPALSSQPQGRRRAILRLGVLVAVLALFGLLCPLLVEHFQSQATPMRIAIAVFTLFPLGAMMGMAFPLGMQLAQSKSASLTPWLWGMNGAASVCASVIAVAIALACGISAAFWTGVVCYVLALLAFITSIRQRPAGA